MYFSCIALTYGFAEDFCVEVINVPSRGGWPFVCCWQCQFVAVAPQEDKRVWVVLLVLFSVRQPEVFGHCSIFISQIEEDHIIKYKM